MPTAAFYLRRGVTLSRQDSPPVEPLIDMYLDLLNFPLHQRYGNTEFLLYLIFGKDVTKMEQMVFVANGSGKMEAISAGIKLEF